MSTKRASVFLIMCLSTSCIVLPFLQVCYNLLGFAFRSSLPIEPCTKAVDDRNEIRQQVFCAIVRLVHDFNFTSLPFEQSFEIAKPETRPSVLVLYDNQGDGLIREESQELRTAVIDA